VLTVPTRGSCGAARCGAEPPSKGTDADDGFLLTRFFSNLLAGESSRGLRGLWRFGKSG